MINWIKKNKNGIYLYGGLLTALVVLVMLAVLTQKPGVIPYNATAISIGSFEIQWYAVFILNGIILAAVLAYFEFKKLGWDTEILFDGLLYAVPLSILGTRIYYVIFNLSDFLTGNAWTTFLAILGYQDGQLQIQGLAIHGAIIVALTFVYFFSKKKKISFWLLADILVIGLLIGQISGRWGNFMNHELYGPPIQSGFIEAILPNFIKKQMVFSGVLRHPTFLYEMLWNFIGLVFLLIARRKRWFKPGDTAGLYLIWYGLGRGAIIEPLRMQGAPGDPLMFLGIPVNVVLSLALLIPAGLALIFIKRKFNPDQKYYVDYLLTPKKEEDNA